MDQSAACSECGESLKPSAKFCHKCGNPAPDHIAVPEPISGTQPAPANRNVFATIGLVLIIPIVAIGIISLLFWKNQEPVPLQASSAANSGGAANMAAMEQVHETLNRLNANLEANPQDLVSLDSLAIMYSIAGSYDKASRFYEKHLEIEPDNKDVKIALGLSYHNLNRTEEALGLMDEILRKEPDYAFALIYKGDILAQTGKVELAETNWNHVVEKYPNTEIAKMAQERIHEYTHVDGVSGN